MYTDDDKFWLWVEKHSGDDPAKLRLKYPLAADGIDYPLAITQIECRRKFSKKLRETLSQWPHFLFPSRLAGEQSTSDVLAAYHASLVIEGDSMLDMTAGLGIDALHCSYRCSSVTAIERNPDTAAALESNVCMTGRDNITVKCYDSREYLGSDDMKPTGTVFIDPARRSADGARVFALSDCEPDVTALLGQLSSLCRRVVIKMSPMLDISHTVSSLGGCSEIIAVGNTTECKELVAVKNFGENADPAVTTIRSVTMVSDGMITFDFTAEEEHQAPMPSCSVPYEGSYLYEPYPAMMKAGAVKLLAERYGLDMLHPNTRLYHSLGTVTGFPGEIFRIERVIDFASKHIKRLHKEYPSLLVTTRNFGMTAEALRRKLGVRDGGDIRLFGVTDRGGKRLMIIGRRTA